MKLNQEERERIQRQGKIVFSAVGAGLVIVFIFIYKNVFC